MIHRRLLPQTLKVYINPIDNAEFDMISKYLFSLMYYVYYDIEPVHQPFRSQIQGIRHQFLQLAYYHSLLRDDVSFVLNLKFIIYFFKGEI